MKHEELALQLAVYRDLKGAERAEVDAHLRECAECAARLRAYQAMGRELARLPELPFDPKLREGFYMAIGGDGQRRVQPARTALAHWFGWMGQLAGAATIVLVIVATWALFQTLGNSGLVGGRSTFTPVHSSPQLATAATKPQNTSLPPAAVRPTLVKPSAQCAQDANFGSVYVSRESGL